MWLICIMYCTTAGRYDNLIWWLCSVDRETASLGGPRRLIGSEWSPDLNTGVWLAQSASVSTLIGHTLSQCHSVLANNSFQSCHLIYQSRKMDSAFLAWQNIWETKPRTVRRLRELEDDLKSECSITHE